MWTSVRPSVEGGVPSLKHLSLGRNLGLGDAGNAGVEAGAYTRPLFS